MRNFAHLVRMLEATSEDARQLMILKSYLRKTDPADINQAIALLIGRSPKRLCDQNTLLQCARDIVLMPDWLFLECLEQLGDLNETIAFTLPAVYSDTESKLSFWMRDLERARKMDQIEFALWLRHSWAKMDNESIFLFNRIISGSLRWKLPEPLIAKALSQEFELDYFHISQKLGENWDLNQLEPYFLISASISNSVENRPYPFINPDTFDANLFSVKGSVWSSELIFPGVRVQLIRNQEGIFIWSESNELLTTNLPEIVTSVEGLSENCVLEGYILAFDKRILPLEKLRARLKRKRVSPKIVAETPTIFLASDILKKGSEDIRSKTYTERRKLLEEIIYTLDSDSRIILSEIEAKESYKAIESKRTSLRENGADALLLRESRAIYNTAGSVLYWKAAPLSLKLVLIYVDLGSWRNDSIELSFAIREGDALIPLTKCRVVLEDQEMNALMIFAKENTIERFGPVRSVRATQVFELGFDRLFESKRKKCGLDISDPFLVRWIKDAELKDVDQLSDLRRLL